MAVVAFFFFCSNKGHFVRVCIWLFVFAKILAVCLVWSDYTVNIAGRAEKLLLLPRRNSWSHVTCPHTLPCLKISLRKMRSASSCTAPSTSDYIFNAKAFLGWVGESAHPAGAAAATFVGVRSTMPQQSPAAAA